MSILRSLLVSLAAHLIGLIVYGTPVLIARLCPQYFPELDARVAVYIGANILFCSQLAALVFHISYRNGYNLRQSTVRVALVNIVYCKLGGLALILPRVFVHCVDHSTAWGFFVDTWVNLYGWFFFSVVLLGLSWLVINLLCYCSTGYFLAGLIDAWYQEQRKEDRPLMSTTKTEPRTPLEELQTEISDTVLELKVIN